jgi:predicted glycogen debranching enzyme
MVILGRALTGDFDSAARREWLVTNGLGGWASGTVAGANTRRYHGVFVPALQPPLGRTVLVSQLNERVTVDGQSYPLSSNEYADGTLDPHGYRHIESFRLDGAIPTWTFALGGSLLEKRLWLVHGADTVFVNYTLVRGSGPVELAVRVMVNHRDAHMETHHAAVPEPSVQPQAGAVVVQSHGVPFYLRVTGGRFEPERVWHHRLKHRVETQRGLPDLEDQFAAGSFVASLALGETWTLVASLEGGASLDWAAALAAEQARAAGLVADARLEREPAWVQQLALAADQFIVRRGAGQTVIAGYHWFGDWGRDTMIALPGLTLATGRHADAAGILRTFARFMDQGMLPNRFPDAGDQPEYNTVDATLWYFHAVEQYVSATGNFDLAAELVPVLADSVRWHWRGTRYGIRVDPNDGLLRAGEPGVQLTWMDAKIGDWVVTPRIGKAVEINALWINALRVMERLYRQLGKAPDQPYDEMLRMATQGFERFWYGEGGCLYDVIDGPDGNDASLRPNQLLAVSLPFAPLRHDQHRGRARAVVDACARELLTSHGLRSLSPRHAGFIGAYGGGPPTRDAAYHQGTVWAWLIGPFVSAHLWAYGDPALARTYLAPFEHHLSDHGLGTIAEIFEGDAPFKPRGAVAQAWSVAEVLRAWREVAAYGGPAPQEAR